MNSDEKFVRLMTEEEEKIFMAKGLKAEGIKEGIQEGIKEGIEQGESNIIKKMFDNNVSTEEISKMLNMSVDEIKNILNNNQNIDN